MADGWTIEAASQWQFLPVTLEETKRHLRVVSDTEDALILSYIRNATTWAESHMDMYVCRRTIVARRNTWPQPGDAICRSLGRPTITAVQYANTDEATTALPSNKWHGLWGGNAYKTRLALRYGEAWPSIATIPDAVQVTLDVGVASIDLVPGDIREAVLLLAGEFYHNRHDVWDAQGVTGQGRQSAKSILAHYLGTM